MDNVTTANFILKYQKRKKDESIKLSPNNFEVDLLKKRRRIRRF
jgi:hypothetical protein